MSRTVEHRSSADLSIADPDHYYLLSPLMGEDLTSPVAVRLSIKRLDRPDRFSVIHLPEIPLRGRKVSMPQNDFADDFYWGA